MARELFRFNGQVVIETDPKPILAPCDLANGEVNTVDETKLAICECPINNCWVDEKNYVIQEKIIVASEQ
jgi:hypothetical protein